MRERPGLNWKTYFTLTFFTASEGCVGILFAPFLHKLGYDFATIGVLVAIQGVMALVSRLPGGIIYRPERGRQLMAASLVTFGISCVLYAMAVDMVHIAMVRALSGLSFGLATTINLAMYMDAIPSGVDKHRAMGLYGGSMAGGFMLGNFSGGVVADMFGYAYGFSLGAVYGVVALALLFLDPSSAAVTALARRVEPRGALAVEGRLAAMLQPIKAFSDPKVVVLAFVAFITNFFHQLGTTFFPLYGLQIGLSLTEIGAIKSAHALTNAVARPLAAPPISRLGHQRASYTCVALLAVLFSIVPFLGLFPMLLALFVLIGTLRAVLLVANSVGIADIDERRISRGMASAMYNASKDLGNLASPVICGTIASIVGLVSTFLVVPTATAAVFFGVTAGLARLSRQTTPARAESHAVK